MKKLIVFILLLLNSNSSNLYSCGYYPYGDDIRYSLFEPALFNFRQYNVFNYNAALLGYNYNSSTTFESNVYDWYDYTNMHVSLESIDEFLNAASLTDINPDSKNEFIRYLYRINDIKSLNYLKIAKRCESANRFISENVWELQKYSEIKISNNTINDLNICLEKEDIIYFKRKYAFQAIRMYYYSNELKQIKSLFEKYFLNKQKDYLYYWALYFYCFTNPKNKDIYVAEVFKNSAEKSYAAYYYFNDNFNKMEALKRARSPKEKASVYIFMSIQKVDKNISNLRKIYTYQANSVLLDQLLVREINKIEDWIYTPYYTYFLPSVYYKKNRDHSTTISTLRNRSEHDRLYAKELLAFIDSISINKTNNPDVWISAKIQLQLLSRNYEICLNEINKFEKQHSSNIPLNDQIEKLKALCIISNQKKGKAIIPKSIESTILKFKDDYKFIFALGRELEYRGNLSDGIALLSFIENKDKVFYLEYFYGFEGVQWQGNRLLNSRNLPYFTKYFDYIDFVYSAKELEQILDKLNTNITSDFKKAIFNKLINDKNYLLDLLGTKYLRENNLQKSLTVFRTIDQKYWDDNYNGWEKDIYSEYTFDQNPFYSFKYTKDFIYHVDKFIVNKKSVIEHLVQYINFIEDPKVIAREVYAFLVANCYYNFGQNGNSWMMRRIRSSSWLSNENFNESYVDEYEYRRNELAISYYYKAFYLTKSRKFKALCLRMIDFVNQNRGTSSKLLKSKFPEYYSDLSNCDHLEEYFKAR